MATKVDRIPSNEEINSRLEDLEKRLARLRALYESFFMGSIKRPPVMPRRDCNRIVLEMQQIFIRNAATRFRFQSIVQKWTLMTSYWNRTEREIETGIYKKDLDKVQRHIADKGGSLTTEQAIALGIPITRAANFVEKMAERKRWAEERAAKLAARTAANLAKAVTNKKEDKGPLDLG